MATDELDAAFENLRVAVAETVDAIKGKVEDVKTEVLTRVGDYVDELLGESDDTEAEAETDSE